MKPTKWSTFVLFLCFIGGLLRLHSKYILLEKDWLNNTDARCILMATIIFGILLIISLLSKYKKRSKY